MRIPEKMSGKAAGSSTKRIVSQRVNRIAAAARNRIGGT